MPKPQAALNTIVERRGVRARLVINRPPLNILDLATIRELNARAEALGRDSEIRWLEIAGAGEKAFSAGTEIRDHFPQGAPEMLREFHALIHRVMDSPVPTLAMVRGHCLGGGLELALACDFIFATEDARLGQPEIKLGCYPPVAAVLLPERVGQKKALEMILSGEPLTATEALGCGLLNDVVRVGELENRVEEFSNKLLGQSSRVLELARRATRAASRPALESALRETERIYLEELLQTEDALEGLQAFLEKRRPEWKGK